MALSPRLSGELISSLSEHVTICEEGVKKLGDIIVEEIKCNKLSASNFSQTAVHPKFDDPFALDWLFIVDTLNFCFWHNENEEGWAVDGYTGYFALCAAINRAQAEKIDVLNPTFYSRITEGDLLKILRSDTRVVCPLINERVKCLHEVGNVLLEKFDGSFQNVIKKANNSAVKLLHLVVDNFKCFRDEAIFKGHKVSFYKRAQILIGDIWACFQNKGFGYFHDIDEITAFADYRIPQTLLWYGAFKYSEELFDKLKSNEILQNGDEQEIEIRGCSIHAVELIKQYVLRKLDGGNINSILVDHFLWDFRRKHAKDVLEKGLPFHKTFSIYY